MNPQITDFCDKRVKPSVPLVIASVYEGTDEHELAEFFESITSQTNQEFSVAICIDGNCSSGVKNILSKFSKHLDKSIDSSIKP